MPRTNTPRAILLLAALLGAMASVVRAQRATGALYQHIAAGRYRPIFAAGVSDSGVAVRTFLLATLPVTNADYLRFVTANPEWKRYKVARVAADSSYLRHWSGDETLGPTAPPTAPVVNVSWFAASAYARAAGGRLPSTAEWELAASRFRRTFANADVLSARVLAWNGGATPRTQPAVGLGIVSDDGVGDLHGLVWEWVDDFNAVVTSGESRGDSGPDAGLFCAGGAALSADPSNYASFMRYALRGSLRGSYSLSTLGFRVARDIDAATTKRRPR